MVAKVWSRVRWDSLVIDSAVTDWRPPTRPTGRNAPLEAIEIANVIKSKFNMHDPNPIGTIQWPLIGQSVAINLFVNGHYSVNSWPLIG